MSPIAAPQLQIVDRLEVLGFLSIRFRSRNMLIFILIKNVF